MINPWTISAFFSFEDARLSTQPTKTLMLMPNHREQQGELINKTTTITTNSRENEMAISLLSWTGKVTIPKKQTKKQLFKHQHHRWVVNYWTAANPEQFLTTCSLRGPRAPPSKISKSLNGFALISRMAILVQRRQKSADRQKIRIPALSRVNTWLPLPFILH